MNKKGNRPDTRVVLKDAATKESVTLAAFWTDKEQPSGGLDRRIKRMKIEWEDQNGERHTVMVNNEGEKCSHYINLYMGEPPSRGQFASRTNQQAASRDPFGGADDIGGDDIPF